METTCVQIIGTKSSNRASSLCKFRRVMHLFCGGDDYSRVGTVKHVVPAGIAGTQMPRLGVKDTSM